MITYILRKVSRGGVTPYSGPTCILAGVTPGKVYASRFDAEVDQQQLNAYNPVGFSVVALVDGKEVDTE